MGMEAQHRSLSMNADLTAEDTLVEKTLMSIQEKVGKVWLLEE